MLVMPLYSRNCSGRSNESPRRSGLLDPMRPDFCEMVSHHYLFLSYTVTHTMIQYLSIERHSNVRSHPLGRIQYHAPSAIHVHIYTSFFINLRHLFRVQLSLGGNTILAILLIGPLTIYSASRHCSQLLVCMSEIPRSHFAIAPSAPTCSRDEFGVAPDHKRGTYPGPRRSLGDLVTSIVSLDLGSCRCRKYHPGANWQAILASSLEKTSRLLRRGINAVDCHVIYKFFYAGPLTIPLTSTCPFLRRSVAFSH
jgi:hypothetical protein